jgi:peptidyl-prolyl cis-trans isomerase C
LRKLAPGETAAAPVETDSGLHIIRLDRYIAGEVLPFAAVRERIAAYLAERSQRLGVAQYVARLAERATLVGVDLPTSAELRVY